MTNMEKHAMAYSAANRIIKELRLYREVLPRQTIRTLRGQALSGDITGAVKGLAAALKEIKK